MSAATVAQVIPCDLTKLNPAVVPQWAYDACTGIAEVEMTSIGCRNRGCEWQHRWCRPCVDAEMRDNPHDRIETRPIGGGQ